VRTLCYDAHFSRDGIVHIAMHDAHIGVTKEDTIYLTYSDISAFSEECEPCRWPAARCACPPATACLLLSVSSLLAHTFGLSSCIPCCRRGHAIVGAYARSPEVDRVPPVLKVSTRVFSHFRVNQSWPPHVCALSNECVFLGLG
jgi:hypothetical protein